MAGFELLRSMRDLKSISDDYRPKKWRANDVELDNTQRSIYDLHNEPFAGDDSTAGNSTEHSGANERRLTYNLPHPMNLATVDIGGPEEEPVRAPLDEIAKVLRRLTYGEMLELAESMWKVNPQGSNITESGLPAVLYQWSISRKVEI